MLSDSGKVPSLRTLSPARWCPCGSKRSHLCDPQRAGHVRPRLRDGIRSVILRTEDDTRRPPHRDTEGLKCLDEHTSLDGHVCKDPLMFKPLNGWVSPNSSEMKEIGVHSAPQLTARRSTKSQTFLEHCKPPRKYKTLELLSHWRGNVRAAPRPQTLGGDPKRATRSSTLIEPPRRDPWWAPGRAPQSSSPVEPPRHLNNLEVVLRI